MCSWSDTDIDSKTLLRYTMECSTCMYLVNTLFTHLFIAFLSTGVVLEFNTDHCQFMVKYLFTVVLCNK